MTNQHEAFIREAIIAADSARNKGNHPFGAVLVHNGEIIMRGENDIINTKDITRHAELNIVREASIIYDTDFLQQCTLYASTEPCPMCSGAIYWSGIPTIVFGCSAKRLNDYVNDGNRMNLTCAELMRHGSRPEISVIGPVLEDEAFQSHIGFWHPESLT